MVSIEKPLSLQNNTVAIVSEPVGFTTNRNKAIEVPFGSPLMREVAGMRRSLTAVIAAEPSNHLCLRTSYAKKDLPFLESS